MSNGINIVLVYSLSSGDIVLSYLFFIYCQISSIVRDLFNDLAEDLSPIFRAFLVQVIHTIMKLYSSSQIYLHTKLIRHRAERINQSLRNLFESCCRYPRVVVKFELMLFDVVFVGFQHFLRFFWYSLLYTGGLV